MRGRIAGRGRRRIMAQGASAAGGRSSRAAQDVFGKPTVLDDPVSRVDAAHARPAHRALRAQGVRRGGDLGHQPVRPMGRGARQGTRLEARARRRRPQCRPRISSTLNGGADRSHAEIEGLTPGLQLPRRRLEPGARLPIHKRRRASRAPARDRRRANRSLAVQQLDVDRPRDRWAPGRSSRSPASRAPRPAIRFGSTTHQFSILTPNRSGGVIAGLVGNDHARLATASSRSWRCAAVPRAPTNRRRRRGPCRGRNRAPAAQSARRATGVDLRARRPLGEDARAMAIWPLRTRVKRSRISGVGLADRDRAGDVGRARLHTGRRCRSGTGPADRDVEPSLTR